MPYNPDKIFSLKSIKHHRNLPFGTWNDITYTHKFWNTWDLHEIPFYFFSKTPCIYIDKYLTFHHEPED